MKPASDPNSLITSPSEEGKPQITHTAGPWRVEGPCSIKYCPDSKDFLILDSREACVAHVIFNEEGGDDREECRADARLIAAAPDLLAALNEVFANCTESDLEPDGFAMIDVSYDAWKKVFSAIAKAEGRE